MNLRFKFQALILYPVPHLAGHRVGVALLSARPQTRLLADGLAHRDEPLHAQRDRLPQPLGYNNI